MCPKFVGAGHGIWQGGEGLSRQLHDAWGAFVTTGDPGWPRYTASGRVAMIFATSGHHEISDPFAVVREAWAGLDWQPGPWWSFEGAR